MQMKTWFQCLFSKLWVFFCLFLCNCASCSTVIFPNWKSCWKYFSYSFKRTANQEAKKGKLLLSILYFFKIRYFRIALDKTKKNLSNSVWNLKLYLFLWLNWKNNSWNLWEKLLFQLHPVLSHLCSYHGWCHADFILCLLEGRNQWYMQFLNNTVVALYRRF